MKIVHIATTLAGGAGTGLVRQHRALLAAGVDSRVLVRDLASASDPLIAEVPQPPHSLWRRALRRTGLLRDRARALERTIARLNARARGTVSYELFSPPFAALQPEAHPWIADADVINLHWIAGTIDWPRFFRCVNTPIVFTLHDQQPYLGGFHYAADGEAHPWLRDLDRSVRRIKQDALGARPLAVVGNSDWNTRAAQASGFFPPGTIFRTIYYPLDATAYAPRSKQAARESFGLAGEHVVVGFACASLRNRRKGFDLLLDALRLLPPATLQRIALLSFGGAGPVSADRTPPTPWIHLGPLEADTVKSAVYSAMDVFVVPSRAEAFGLTAIEALACETAVIASHVGGLVEAVDGGCCGRLVEAGSPSALAAAIQEYVNAPDLRRQTASLGRQHVLSRHDPSRSAQAYLQVYEQLIARRPDSRSPAPPLACPAP